MKERSIIGVDLGGTNIRAGKVNNDSVTGFYSQQISSSGSENEILEEIISSINKIFDDSVLGIGVGVPSVVDIKRGIVYDVQNLPALKEVPLKEILEKKFKIPVYINNDANCFAAGEKYFGAGKNYENIVGLILGTGLGAGIYTNGRLYAGANCGAGEFGMLPYKDGVYEDYCSGKYFKIKFNTTGEKVYHKAEAGDREALKIFDEFGTHVGNAVSAIIFSVDPEIIILGGSVSIAFKYFRNSLENVLKEFPYQNSVKNLKIVESTLSQVSILGAAALYHEYKGM